MTILQHPRHIASAIAFAALVGAAGQAQALGYVPAEGPAATPAVLSAGALSSSDAVLTLTGESRYSEAGNVLLSADSQPDLSATPYEVHAGYGWGWYPPVYYYPRYRSTGQ